MRRRLWQTTLFTLMASGIANQAQANGLAINEQNASYMGMAFAGRASAALDASTVFGNPAGMSRLNRPEVSGGVAWVTVDTSIDNARSDIPGITGTAYGDMVEDQAVPFGFVVTPLNDRWHAGFGLYVPFALIDDYEDSFIGRYRAERSSVKVITLQPTLSYRLTDRVAVGFGPTFSRIDGELSNNLNFVAGDALLDVEGDDYGYGYTVGLLADLTPTLSWGLTYRSKVDYTLEGDTTLSGVPPVLPGLDALNGRYDASLDFTTPESLDSSLTWRVNPRWTLHATAIWTRWSRLEEIVVESEGVPLPAFGTVEEELDWEDTWTFAVGAAYQLDRDWVLRAGLGFDGSPTRDSVRTARIPVGDRALLGLGAAWSPSRDLTVDFAYLYVHEEEVEVNQQAKILPTSGGPLPIQPGFFGDYQTRIHVFAAQLTHRF